jgi:hypothetical protein
MIYPRNWVIVVADCWSIGKPARRSRVLTLEKKESRRVMIAQISSALRRLCLRWRLAYLGFVLSCISPNAEVAVKMFKSVDFFPASLSFINHTGLTCFSAAWACIKRWILRKIYEVSVGSKGESMLTEISKIARGTLVWPARENDGRAAHRPVSYPLTQHF